MVSSAEPLLIDLDLLAEDEFTPAITSAGASLEELESRVASVTAVLERFNALVEESAEPLGAVGEGGQSAAGGLESYSAATDAAAGSNDALAEALSGLEGQLATLQAATEEAAASNSALAESNAALSGELNANTDMVYRNSVALEENAAAKEANAGATRSAGAANESFAGGLGNAHMAAMLTTAGIAALEFETVKLGGSLEVADAKLVSFAGVSQSAIGGLNQQMLDLTRQTGEAPKKVADGLYYAVSAGFAYSDAMKITADSTRLATAAETDAKTVVDVTTSALKAYGQTAADTAHVQDVLQATTVAGKMEFSDLAGALGRVLPVASQMGISLDQVGASIATMTTRGLSADEAVTSLRGILLALEIPSKTAQQELQNIGLSAAQLRQELQDKGLLATLQDLMARTGGNVDQLHELVPNVRALVGVLADASNGGTDYARALDQISNSHGNAAAAWERYEKTGAAAAEHFKGTVIAAMTETGLGIVKGVEPGMKAINDLLGLLDSTGAGGHGGIAQLVGRVLQAQPAVQAFSFGDNLVSGNYAQAAVQVSDVLAGIPGFGMAAAGGLQLLEDRFKSGSEKSKAYAEGVALANANLEKLASLPSEKNPFDFIKDVQSQDADLFGQYHQVTTLETQARADGNKKLADQLHADAQKILGQIDADTNAIKAKRKELDDALRAAPQANNNIDEGAPPPGWMDQWQKQQPGALPTDVTAGFKHAADDIAHIFQANADWKNSPAVQALHGLDVAAEDAASQLAATQTKLSALLSYSPASDAAKLALTEDALVLDSIDKTLNTLNPQSTAYNDLVAARAEYVQKTAAPHQEEIKLFGDEANGIATVVDLWRQHRLSNEAASTALENLAAHQLTVKGVTIDVAGATREQIDTAKAYIQVSQDGGKAFGDLAAGVAKAIAPWKQTKTDAQAAAAESKTAAETTKTALASVGDARADLGEYQRDLTGKATTAGDAARAAIVAQLQNITATASVNIQTTITQTTQTVGGAASGGANAGGAGNVMALPGGGGAGLPAPSTMMALVADDTLGGGDEVDFGGPSLSLLEFSLSGGPNPPPLPKPTAPHISTSPPKPATAKGAAAGGAPQHRDSAGVASQAQSVAAAHKALQTDVQSMHDEIDAALAGFDEILAPNGKNALLARLTADLTSADSVAGMADATDILFREAMQKAGSGSGSGGTNASADQLVNDWFQHVSKGVTDPAKLAELKDEAGRMLQALADAMPDIVRASESSKQIDLAAEFFGSIANPDSVKSLTQQAVAILESGRPDAEEAVRRLLFGDGSPTRAQLSDASKVATAVRDQLLKDLDSNDPNVRAKAVAELDALLGSMQDEANRVGITIPVSVGGAGGGPLGPGEIGVPPPGVSGGLAPAGPDATYKSALQASQSAAGTGLLQAKLDDLTDQAEKAVREGRLGDLPAILQQAGSNENAQKILQKVLERINSTSGTGIAIPSQLSQANSYLSQLATWAPQALPNASPTADADANRQIGAALDTTGAQAGIEQAAQQVASLVQQGKLQEAQRVLAGVNHRDYKAVYDRAYAIIQEQATKAGTDVTAMANALRAAGVGAAPTAAHNLTPEEIKAKQDEDYKKTHDPAYWSSKEAVAESDAITARRNADPGGDFGKNSANAGTVFLYASDAVMEQIRQGERAYKQMMEQQLAIMRDSLGYQKLQYEAQHLKPIEVRVLATMNGRVVAEEVSYHTGQTQQYADLGMPVGSRG